MRIHVDASGVCHSDLSAAQGKVPMGTPLILGHEGTGTVLAVGSDVSRVKPGDRIIASFVPACGDCFFCLNDQSQLCEGMGAASFGVKGTRPDGSEIRGMTGLGTFADEMQIEESMCVKIETDLPSDQLALIGCGVTTGVGAALNTAQIRPGSTVAIIGCGGVGQSVLQGARIAGASRIFAIDPVEMKRKTAEQLGATDLIDPGRRRPGRAGAGAHRGPRRRLRVRGDRPPRDDPAGVRDGPPGRHRGRRRHVGVRCDRHPLGDGALLRLEDARSAACTAARRCGATSRAWSSLVETGRLDIGSMVSRRIKLDEVNDAFRAMEAGEVIRSVIV